MKNPEGTGATPAHQAAGGAAGATTIYDDIAGGASQEATAQNQDQILSNKPIDDQRTGLHSQQMDQA